MKKVTASSPTESGCAGVSRPVRRKGMMLYTSVILGLAKGTEVDILDEYGEYCKVRSVSEPNIVKWVFKDVIKEVECDA